MFKNKHIIVAMIVAPILAVGAYFTTDYVVSEKPHLAKEGGAYQLIPKSNCRYKSGRCTFKNGTFEASLQAKIPGDNTMVLSLDSVHSLDGVKLVLLDGKQFDNRPVDMQADNAERTRWVVTLPQTQHDNSQLRIVMAANSAVYFGETQTDFFVYETSFKEDFRGDGY
ncbi:MAG: hypothetical protein JKY66_10460 [Spongiibacteraceae bacterium]|nr:hypothetical protein [Spongiibacteraceae bacterium]